MQRSKKMGDGLVARQRRDPRLPCEDLASGWDDLFADQDSMRPTSATRGGARPGGVPQGGNLTNAIKTTERKLARNALKQGGSRLMAFAVDNAKAEARGNAIHHAAVKRVRHFPIRADDLLA